MEIYKRTMKISSILDEEIAVTWSVLELIITGTDSGRSSECNTKNVYAAIKIQNWYRDQLKRKGFYTAWYRFIVWWKHPCCKKF